MVSKTRQANRLLTALPILMHKSVGGLTASVESGIRTLSAPNSGTQCGGGPSGGGPCLYIIIIVMYIYHALINALSAHIIHINLNTILYTYVEDSPSKTIYARYYICLLYTSDAADER